MKKSEGGKGNGKAKKLYYCYYWKAEKWQLYQPRFEAAGKRSQVALEIDLIYVQTLIKPDSILIVSTARKKVPTELKELGSQPTRKDLKAKKMTLHRQRAM